MKLATAITLCNDARWIEDKIQFKRTTFPGGERYIIYATSLEVIEQINKLSEKDQKYFVDILKCFCVNMKDLEETGMVWSVVPPKPTCERCLPTLPMKPTGDNIY